MYDPKTWVWPQESTNDDSANSPSCRASRRHRGVTAAMQESIDKDIERHGCRPLHLGWRDGALWRYQPRNYPLAELQKHQRRLTAGSQFVITITVYYFRPEPLHVPANVHRSYRRQLAIEVQGVRDAARGCGFLGAVVRAVPGAGPIIEKVAEEHHAGGPAKLNTERTRRSRAFRIQGIPAVKAFRDAEVIAEFHRGLPGTHRCAPSSTK